MDKKEQRMLMIEQLRLIEKAHYDKKSEAIINKLVENQTFQDATVIGVTISRFPEVDTLRLIERSWQFGKTIVVPKCHAKTRGMDFHKITSFQQLETVYMDLQEPIVEKTTLVEKENIDLLVVPGVVYSKKGYRIGFGGGYYDRYLADFKGRTISLAFHQQVTNHVPVESHDIPVAKIITEKGIIDCRKD